MKHGRLEFVEIPIKWPAVTRETKASKSVSAAIDSRRRLVQWFDNARKRLEAARRTGRGRVEIAQIMAAFRKDILGGPDRHLIHRIPLPSPPSGEETVYLFPGHRAIHEIRTLWGRRHCFITFIECDRDSEELQPADKSRQAAEI